MRRSSSISGYSRRTSDGGNTNRSQQHVIRYIDEDAGTDNTFKIKNNSSSAHGPTPINVQININNFATGGNTVNTAGSTCLGATNRDSTRDQGSVRRTSYQIDESSGTPRVIQPAATTRLLEAPSASRRTATGSRPPTSFRSFGGSPAPSNASFTSTTGPHPIGLLEYPNASSHDGRRNSISSQNHSTAHRSDATIRRASFAQQTPADSRHDSTVRHSDAPSRHSTVSHRSDAPGRRSSVVHHAPAPADSRRGSIAHHTPAPAGNRRGSVSHHTPAPDQSRQMPHDGGYITSPSTPGFRTVEVSPPQVYRGSAANSTRQSHANSSTQGDGKGKDEGKPSTSKRIMGSIIRHIAKH